ncbi:hypothetical protein [Tenacibaculum sp. 190524A05c]|uniref:hypothetical protein n=1 Tax=Tenacibaculum platacis TaxID=3137852 RepID=UPI0031FB5476
MSEKNLSMLIDGLISPDAGKQLEPTEEDKKIINEFQKEFEKLSDEEKLLTFKNLIRNTGRCGFASSGTIQYLVNTDRNNRYRVTVRTYWRQGINSGKYDRVYITQAGGRTQLGCTQSGMIPVASYSRQVVGEQKF